MDTWLKWLVAAACCVVIAIGGVYAYGAVHRKMAADAFTTKRSSCLGYLDEFYGNRVSTDLAKQVDNCVLRGYLAKAEVDTKLNPNID